MSRPFETASNEERAFFSHVFWHALLNQKAVELGHYPMLLCEMTTPQQAMDWKNKAPAVFRKITGEK